MKLGALLVFAALAFLWVQNVVADKWSWVIQLGTTSLLVYWVHIEIVYGSWFGFWKEHLNAAGCVLYSVLLIAAMIGLSIARTKLKKVRWFPRWTPGLRAAQGTARQRRLN